VVSHKRSPGRTFILATFLTVLAAALRWQGIYDTDLNLNFLLIIIWPYWIYEAIQEYRRPHR
jgi:hypothetical protein